jgi:hypothetical protein
MMKSPQGTRKRPLLLILAFLFSILIIVENLPQAARRLIRLFAPPDRQDFLIVGVCTVLPLALLWASWAVLRKRKHASASFLTAGFLIFLAMDYFLPYPGPAKMLFFMIDEGRKIFAVALQEDSSDAPFLTKQGNPIGVSFRYTLKMPAGGTYLVQTHLSPASRTLTPEEAGIDPGGSALQVATGPDEWLTAPSKMTVTRTGNAIPKFIIYNKSKDEFCLFRLAADLLKDDPGLTKYRVELQIGGQQTLLEQAALLHFDTRNSYDVRQFYDSALKEHMPFCVP